MRLVAQVSIVALLAAVVGIGWWTTNRGGDDVARKTTRKGESATLVLVENVKFAEDKIVVRAIGTGQALKSASIHPSVAGEVMKVAFRAGDRVTKGAPLVRLDDKHQRLSVRLAEVAMNEAARQVRRLKQLAPSGAASVARLETAQNEYESARLRLDQAKAALEDRTVFAPFEGVIGLTEIERGDRVSVETLIATLDNRASILVDFSLPEEYAAKLRLGDTLTLRPWTARDMAIEGKVVTLGSRIDPVSRTLRVKAEIPNEDDLIRPGTSFDVQLVFRGNSYAAIPEVAVLWSRDGAYLWRVVDSRAEKVFVAIVRRDKGRILVDGPLNDGDAIVVEGVQGLRPAQAVKTEFFESPGIASKVQG